MSGITRVKATLTAENTWSDWIWLDAAFRVSIRGTFVSAVALQMIDRDFAEGADAPGPDSEQTIATYTGPIQDYGDEVEEGAWFRIGVPLSGYTSGTVYASIRKGNSNQ